MFSFISITTVHYQWNWWNKFIQTNVILLNLISILVRFSTSYSFDDMLRNTLSMHSDIVKKESGRRWVERYFRQKYLVWPDRTIGRNIDIILNFVCHRDDKWYETKNYLHRLTVYETLYSYSTRDMYQLWLCLFFIQKQTSIHITSL